METIMASLKFLQVVVLSSGSFKWVIGKGKVEVWVPFFRAWGLEALQGYRPP